VLLSAPLPHSTPVYREELVTGGDGKAASLQPLYDCVLPAAAAGGIGMTWLCVAGMFLLAAGMGRCCCMQSSRSPKPESMLFPGQDVHEFCGWLAVWGWCRRAAAVAWWLSGHTWHVFSGHRGPCRPPALRPCLSYACLNASYQAALKGDGCVCGWCFRGALLLSPDSGLGVCVCW
jgi:hypothetical protein